MVCGLLGVAAFAPADAGPAGRLPGVADILAAERYEHDYCLEQARKHPGHVTCGKSVPTRVSELKCRPREDRHALCGYTVVVEDGTSWKSPNQFYEKEGDRWILKSVIRMKD
jgi:hypothetical protein